MNQKEIYEVQLHELADGFPIEYKLILEIIHYKDEIPTIGDITANTCLSRKYVHKALKIMRANGILDFGTLHEIDNCQKRHGSGYYPSVLGRMFMRHLGIR